MTIYVYRYHLCATIPQSSRGVHFGAVLIMRGKCMASTELYRQLSSGLIVTVSTDIFKTVILGSTLEKTALAAA